MNIGNLNMMYTSWLLVNTELLKHNNDVSMIHESNMHNYSLIIK